MKLLFIILPIITVITDKRTIQDDVVEIQNETIEQVVVETDDTIYTFNINTYVEDSELEIKAESDIMILIDGKFWDGVVR